MSILGRRHERSAGSASTRCSRGAFARSFARVLERDAVLRVARASWMAHPPACATATPFGPSGGSSKKKARQSARRCPAAESSLYYRRLFETVIIRTRAWSVDRNILVSCIDLKALYHDGSVERQIAV